MAVQVPSTAEKPPVVRPEPQRRRRTRRWIALALALLIVAGIALFALVAQQRRTEASREVMVHYLVDGGGAGGAVTYTVGDADTTQRDPEVTLPWSREVTVKGLDKAVTLTAQNGSENTTISCRIRQGDTVIAEHFAHGPFAIASCGGSVD